jgi:hypothetical protein
MNPGKSSSIDVYKYDMHFGIGYVTRVYDVR